MGIDAVNNVNNVNAFAGIQQEAVDVSSAKGSVFEGQGQKTQQTSQKPLPNPVKPTEPVKPKILDKKPEIAGQKKYKVQYGDTASQIAERYHITMAELEAANPGKNLGMLIAGEKGNVINLPYRNDGEWKAYKAAESKYQADRSKYVSDLALYEKIVDANNKVKQLREVNKNRPIEINVDANTGEIKITIKSPMTLGDIKEAMGIKAKGRLLEANPSIKKNYKPDTAWGFKWGEGLRKEAQWDDLALRAGETLVIPADIIN